MPMMHQIEMTVKQHAAHQRIHLKVMRAVDHLARAPRMRDVLAGRPVEAADQKQQRGRPRQQHPAGEQHAVEREAQRTFQPHDPQRGGREIIVEDTGTARTLERPGQQQRPTPSDNQRTKRDDKVETAEQDRIPLRALEPPPVARVVAVEHFMIGAVATMVDSMRNAHHRRRGRKEDSAARAQPAVQVRIRIQAAVRGFMHQRVDRQEQT